MVLNNENALLPNLHFAEVLGTQTISVFIYDEKVFPEGLSVRKIHPFLPSPCPQKTILSCTHFKESRPNTSGEWKAESCSDALRYLLSRQTRASDGILLLPVLIFPALRNYQNGKYALVLYSFQKPSFRKLNYSFHCFTSYSIFSHLISLHLQMRIIMGR